MLPEQTSKPIACPKKLLAFASFKILEIIIEKALEISESSNNTDVAQIFEVMNICSL